MNVLKLCIGVQQHIYIYIYNIYRQQLSMEVIMEKYAITRVHGTENRENRALVGSYGKCKRFEHNLTIHTQLRYCNRTILCEYVIARNNTIQYNYKHINILKLCMRVQSGVYGTWVWIFTFKNVITVTCDTVAVGMR